MAEEPLITESKRPQIKTIIKSKVIIQFRIGKEDRIKKIAVVYFSKEVKRTCFTINKLLLQ